jgi:hypothetical protein
MATHKIQKLDPSTSKVIGEFADLKSAAESIDKPNGTANILLCCGNNHLIGDNARKAYGFCWRFSD